MIELGVEVEADYRDEIPIEVKDLLLELTRSLVTGRKKSSWWSYGRCWNRIPDVKVLIVRIEIVNLQLFLITLSTSANAGRDGLEKFNTVINIARRRRFQLPDWQLRLWHVFISYGTWFVRWLNFNTIIWLRNLFVSIYVSHLKEKVTSKVTKTRTKIFCKFIVHANHFHFVNSKLHCPSSRLASREAEIFSRNNFTVGKINKREEVVGKEKWTVNTT